MNGAPDRRTLVPPHLPDSVLLAHLDGELSRPESEGARTHLESCWSCRRRLSALEASIATFLGQRVSLQPQLALDGEQRVRQFRERLARHAATSELTVGETLRAYWHAIAGGVLAHRQAALASVVALCLVVAMFTDVLGTRVSADTVLRRAQSFEVSQQAHPGQVTRVALRVDRIRHASGTLQPLGSITIIEDSDRGQEYLVSESATAGRGPAMVAPLNQPRAASSQLALLEQEMPASVLGYLRSQHWLPAVTVEAFRQLTAGRGLTSSSVQKQDGAFVLIYPFAAGHASGISDARLRVDRNDFATMGLSLFLSTPADVIEYRFTRTAITIEPRTAEIAQLFLPHDVTNSSRSLPTRTVAKVMPLSYATTHATDEEVRLTAALHAADACLGEELHVFPMSDGSLLVQGLVDKTDRRDVILKALRSADPSVPTQVFLPRELKSGSQLFALPYQAPEIPATLHSPPGATLADLSSQRIPLYEQLYQHFSRAGAAPDETEKQINAFSNEAVTLARQTFLHAWALKKLDLEFSAERSARLSPSAVQELEKLRQDHRRWIATNSHRQSEMLAQVGGASPELPVSQASTLPDTDTLLRLAREQNDLVRSLFTVSNTTPESGSNLARLLAVLHRMGA